MGLGAAVYVLALAGGTGVGKSSILNALAGREVSTAGVRRPTTGEPVAWVPSAARADLAPVLDWIGVTEIVEHGGAELADVAVVDLPDLDSIAGDHRARVDALLPRVDAVVWVSDPEKYQDAILHDGYLRRWGPRLGRQAIVVNKQDLVAIDDVERIRADLRARLRDEGLGGLEVMTTTALAPPAGPTYASGGDAEPGVADLRTWLSAGVEAKRVIAARLAAEARAAAMALLARTGVDPERAEPLVTPTRRRAALDEVTREVLGIVDLEGLERQAVAATRSAARPRGGGPLGILVELVYRASGRAQTVADPSGYVRRWRERGSLVRAVEPLRRLVGELLPRVPPAARPALAAIATGDTVQGRLAEAIDRAVTGEASRFSAPTSRLWPFLGAAQYAATASVVLGVVWLLALVAGIGGEVPTLDVPALGPVPLPVALVVGGIFAGFIIGRLLALHAGWLGRRWAARLRDVLSGEVRTRMETAILAPLDALEAARRALADAARAIASNCDPDAIPAGLIRGGSAEGM